MSKKHNNSAPRKTSWKQILLRILCAILGLLIGCSLYIYKLLGGFQYVVTPIVSEKEYETLVLTADGSLNGGDVDSSWADGGHTRVYVDPEHPIIEVKQKDKNVENILVFGVDSRGSDDYKCRSDAMMVVSINKEEETVKLISLMRDTGVYIGDTKSTQSTTLDKLTHAYAYGGVGLLINTINLNFDLDIQRFVMLDFGSAADIIDLVGGVEIDVSPEEVKYANYVITEMNTLVENPAPLLTSGGKQTLSGVQAIGWSRIRYLDSDFVRTSRQRTVATALINKVSSMNYLSQMALIEDSTGMFETNMQKMDLARVGLNGITGADNISEYRVPEDGLYTVQDNPWMMIVNMDTQLPKLKEFIWGE
ncbi:MAG: LCP family protein [Clostridiales bacterium]|nr:LCP family protein [Clostridiales bacterium]